MPTPPDRPLRLQLLLSHRLAVRRPTLPLSTATGFSVHMLRLDHRGNVPACQSDEPPTAGALCRAYPRQSRSTPDHYPAGALLQQSRISQHSLVFDHSTGSGCEFHAVHGRTNIHHGHDGGADGRRKATPTPWGVLFLVRARHVGRHLWCDHVREFSGQSHSSHQYRSEFP